MHVFFEFGSHFKCAPHKSLPPGTHAAPEVKQAGNVAEEFVVGEAGAAANPCACKVTLPSPSSKSVFDWKTFTVTILLPFLNPFAALTVKLLKVAAVLFNNAFGSILNPAIDEPPLTYNDG